MNLNPINSVAGASTFLDAKLSSLTSAASPSGNEKVQSDALDPERIQEISEGFESVFLSLLLKEMRNTLDESSGGLFGEEGSDTYGGMFDMFMGQAMAETRSLGIADAVQSYLSNMR